MTDEASPEEQQEIEEVLEKIEIVEDDEVAEGESEPS